MDLKQRLHNKTFVASLLAAIVAFVYEIMGLCGIVPMIGEDQITQVVAMVLTTLVSVGILIDPTTEGVTDSLSIEEQNKLTGMPSGEVLKEDEVASQEPAIDIEEEVINE